MIEYLSHFSAAAIWNTPYIEAVLGPEIAKTTSADRTVSEHKTSFRINGRRVHSCELALPSDAITTKRKLKAFLSKTSGHRGHRKAEQALKYIEDGSASVMESIAYMILTSPLSQQSFRTGQRLDPFSRT